MTRTDPRSGCELSRLGALLLQPIAACLVVCLVVDDCWAQYSTMTTFVTRGSNRREVLRVDSKLELPPSMTFGNMQVTISSTQGPSTADRDLLVVFYTKSWGQAAQTPAAYRVPVRLAEGQTQVVVDIPHVQTQGQSSWDVTVYEGGRDIEDKRQRKPNDMDFQWTYVDAPSFGFGFLYADTEDLSQLQTAAQALSDVYSSRPWVNQTAASRTYGGQTQVGTQHLLVPIRTAAADWRRYYPYDAWFLSLTALRDLRTRRPELAIALRDYVAAGGILVLHGVSQPGDRAEIDAFLGLQPPATIARTWSRIQTSKLPWWQTPVAPTPAGGTATRPTNAPREDSTNNALHLTGVAYDAVLAAETWSAGRWGGHKHNLQQVGELLELSELDTSPLDRLRADVLTQVDAEAILRQDYLLGTVLMTVEPLADIPMSLFEQTKIGQSPNRLSATTAGDSDGNWFWRNLIAAVGKPPVWTFCAMVTLFGGLLGPGLLVLTGRMKRRSLMILLVPCVSLMATLSIIVYGVLHEGLGTHIRVTSIEFVDATTQTGFAWSRQNYFSGLPPRDGLHFELDTYARNVQPEDEQRYNNADPKDSVASTITLAEQQTWQGWLKPRRQQQLLIGHPIRQVTLPIAIAREADDKVRVTNQTRSNLPFVLIRGAEDDYYCVENLPGQKSMVLEVMEVGRAGSLASRVLADYRPEAPPELQAGNSLWNLGSRRNQATRIYEGNDIINVVFRDRMSDKFNMPRFGFTVLATEFSHVQVPLAGDFSQNAHLVAGVQAW